MISGSNRGLGRAFCEGLLHAGAAKIYAAARDPLTVRGSDSRVSPIKLDVTSVSGEIINVLSVASWFTNPFMATYCASKAAVEVLTDAIRMQLRSQNTHVVGVYAGYLDTDMAAHVRLPKTSPQQVVMRSLEGVEGQIDRVFADDRAIEVDRRVRTDRTSFYEELQQRWNQSERQS